MQIIQIFKIFIVEIRRFSMKKISIEFNAKILNILTYRVKSSQFDKKSSSFRVELYY